MRPSQLGTARFPLRAASALVLGGLLALGGALSLAAEESAPPDSRQPDFETGKAIFDQAIRWVSAGKPVVHNIETIYVELEDVQMQVDEVRYDGFLRIWFQRPDKYRIEIRPQRGSSDVTTKLLVGDALWILTAEGAKRMHGTPEGQRAIQQLKTDRDRLSDLAGFLTLQALKGEGVQFDYVGTTSGTGVFEGEWLKVNRVVGQTAQLLFFFAFDKDDQGRVVQATWPGVVTVVGEAAEEAPTEYFVLRNWKDGPVFRYPSRIEAYKQVGPDAEMDRFMLGFVREIKLNARMPAAAFAPPGAAR